MTTRSSQRLGCNKVIGSKWVFKRKLQNDGYFRYKARLVAQGFTQKKNLHYDEVFLATVKAETMRVALALAASRDNEPLLYYNCILKC